MLSNRWIMSCDKRSRWRLSAWQTQTSTYQLFDCITRTDRFQTMTEVLTAHDPLYEELYDVRREAEEAGNLVEEDMNPKMNALRDKAPVQKGFLRELLGMPDFQRHAAAKGRQGYTCFSYDICDQAF